MSKSDVPYVNSFKLPSSPQHKFRGWFPDHCGPSGTPQNITGQRNRGQQGGGFLKNKTCFGKTVSSACPKEWKSMKIKNCLPPSKMQMHLLFISCRLQVLAGAHAIFQGLTAAQGRRSDYVFRQKVSLNLNKDSVLLLLLLFRELSEKSNTMFSYNLKHKIFKWTF